MRTDNCSHAGYGFTLLMYTGCPVANYKAGKVDSTRRVRQKPLFVHMPEFQVGELSVLKMRHREKYPPISGTNWATRGKSGAK